MEARFDYRGSQQHEASYPLLKSLENEDVPALRNILGRYLSRLPYPGAIMKRYISIYFY